MSVWPRWGAAQYAARGLSGEQGRMLSLLCGIQTDGRVAWSVARIAESFGKSVRTTERRLDELERLGLFVTERRGSQTAVRVLNGGVTPTVQERADAQMDLLSTGPNNGLLTAQKTPPARGGSATVADGGSATPWSGGSNPPSQGMAEEVNDVGKEGGKTRTSAPGPGVVRAVPDTVDRVLAELQAGPDWLVVDRDSVASVLIRFPEPEGHDHVDAAIEVRIQATEAQALGGQTTVTVASMLLTRKLERQRERASQLLPGRPLPTTRNGADRATAKPDKPWSGALQRAREQAQGGAA